LERRGPARFARRKSAGPRAASRRRERHSEERDATHLAVLGLLALATEAHDQVRAVDIEMQVAQFQIPLLALAKPGSDGEVDHQAGRLGHAFARADSLLFGRRENGPLVLGVGGIALESAQYFQPRAGVVRTEPGQHGLVEDRSKKGCAALHGLARHAARRAPILRPLRGKIEEEGGHMPFCDLMRFADVTSSFPFSPLLPLGPPCTG
jgi:hypothetical protein